jgi:hypothetical protein
LDWQDGLSAEGKKDFWAKPTFSLEVGSEEVRKVRKSESINMLIHLIVISQ